MILKTVMLAFTISPFKSQNLNDIKQSLKHEASFEDNGNVKNKEQYDIASFINVDKLCLENCCLNTVFSLQIQILNISLFLHYLSSF